jgi:hypothetical protein
MSISTTVGRLPGNGFALSDDRGGWRIEEYFSSGQLRSVQDTEGLVVEVIWEAVGRPVGIIFGKDLALEYTYSDRTGVWRRKLLYNQHTREQLAEVVNPRAGEIPRAQQHRAVNSVESCSSPVIEPAMIYGGEEHLVACVEGRRYAMLPVAGRGRVIRSVIVRGPPKTAIQERVDYTDSELIIHISTGDPGRTVVVAAARNREDTRTPIVIDGGVREVTKYLAVSATGKRTAASGSAEPSLNGKLPSSVTTTLVEAFPLALESIRRNRACLALFEPFLVSGVDRLKTTFYAPPSAGRKDDACGENTLAYTHVGSPVTHLCAGFGTLSRENAAVILIHEALHFAGMAEAPQFPDALTSQEIHRLVIESCGF